MQCVNIHNTQLNVTMHILLGNTKENPKTRDRDMVMYTLFQDETIDGLIGT